MSQLNEHALHSDKNSSLNMSLLSCDEQNVCVPPKMHMKPQRAMWLYLEIQLSWRQLRLNEAIGWSPKLIELVSYKKKTMISLPSV